MHEGDSQHCYSVWLLLVCGLLCGLPGARAVVGMGTNNRVIGSMTGGSQHGGCTQVFHYEGGRRGLCDEIEGVEIFMASHWNKMGRRQCQRAS